MAGGADRRTLVLALAGAGLAAALARFPLADATRGPWTLAAAAASLLLLGLPLLVAEAALGRYRRRNAVDAFGPGAWKGLGLLLAVGALAAAALLSVLAGWSLRYLAGSFEGAGFGDPARHFRLLSSGRDALLLHLAVLAAATLLALRGAGRGLRGPAAALAVAALLLLAGLAAWANVRGGAAGDRSALLDPGAPFDASDATGAVLAGLLPALLATGVPATLSARAEGRRLPGDAGLAALLALLGLAAAVLFLAPLSAREGVALGGGPLATYEAVPALFAGVGGATGGVLAGCFFAALLLASLAALPALLAVPAAWLAEAFPSWTGRRALAASGLLAYLAGVPFCFSAQSVGHLAAALAWVLAPLAGLLVSAHVGWARPEVLDGLRVGEARARLDAALVPALRYALPPAMALLLALGTLGFLRQAGWADGSGGLWDLAP